jgi:hypothetical protein
MLLAGGTSPLVVFLRVPLDVGQQGEGATAIRDLCPEDRPSFDEGPIEHDRNEGASAEARQEEAKIGCQSGVEGGFIEARVAEKTAQALVGSAMGAGRTGEGTSEPSQGQGAAGKEGGAQAQAVLALVAGEGQGEVVDEEAECGIMSMEHGLLLSLTRVHDAPKERPFLHAIPPPKRRHRLLPSRQSALRSFGVRHRR